LNALTGSFYLVGTLAFVLVSLAVGSSLVALSRRTGERPELYLGLGILGTAVFGYGVQIASVILRGGPEGGNELNATMVGLTAVGKLLHDAGVTLVLLFVLKVFRPSDARARMLFGLAVSTLWIGMVGLGATGGYHDLMHRNLFWWMEYGVIWTYPLWGAYESFRYHRLMRKRARLGLGDALTANRFLLWGLASMGTFTAVWLTSWPMLLADPTSVASLQTFNYLATATVGVFTVTLYSLAFLPPAWYRHWITEPAPAGTPQAA
jgi:hypothetical protein